jgi:hypothetical protein
MSEILDRFATNIADLPVGIIVPTLAGDRLGDRLAQLV